MTRLAGTTGRDGSADVQSAFLISECADQLITSATLFGDIRSGLWLFIARLGEGIPAATPAVENRLWTAEAQIDVEAAPRSRKYPAERPDPDSIRLHSSNTDTMERVLAFDGAGIAVCLDRRSIRNDDLIWSLTCVLEPRHPDDTGPVLWYGQPPRPPRAPASNGGGS